MSPEALASFERAGALLLQADAMLAVGLDDSAGRTATMAGFHAAQALIFEAHNQVMKTHRGVQTEFLRITKDDPRVDATLRGFLSQAYKFKAAADYGTGPDAEVSAQDALQAAQAVGCFVTFVRGLVESHAEPPGAA